MKKRLLSMLLCLCMLAGVLPLSGTAYAKATGCTHQHDSTCGYEEAVEGRPCTFTHTHDDTCGYAEAAEGSPCTFTHKHDDTCGYA